jgi:hypothetical protein
MAGAYCEFCGHRCFVHRIVPDGPRTRWSGHIATCPAGMAHDLAVLGHTHLTAINPIAKAIEPEGTPDMAEEDERNWLEDRRQAWTAGSERAQDTADQWTALGDALARRISDLWKMTPSLPAVSNDDWCDQIWPETGVKPDAVGKQLRRAMAGAYAIAGAYGRASRDLDAALRRAPRPDSPEIARAEP